MSMWHEADADVVGDMRRWVVSEREKSLVRQPTVLPRSLLAQYAENVVMETAAAMGIDAVIEDPPPVFHRGGALSEGGPPDQTPGPDLTMINSHHLGAPGAQGLFQLVPSDMRYSDDGYAICPHCGTRYASDYGELHVVCSPPRTQALDWAMINNAQREWEREHD